MTIVIWFIVIVLSSSWVAYDGIKNNLGGKGSDTPNPLLIGAACLLVWVVCFPYYLIKRKKYVESAQKNPMKDKYSIGSKLVFVAALIATTAFSFNSLMNVDLSYGLPNCDAPATVQTLKQLTDESLGVEVEYSNIEQVGYDSSTMMRTCRAGWSYGEESGIATFNIEWYSEKQERFIVTIQ